MVMEVMEAFHLEQRLVALETRLSSIETQLKNAKAIPIVDDEWSESPSASISLSRPAGDHVNGSYKSGNWLGIIAVICFVVAAGFIIKLSIDSGWLTPDRQLGLSGLLGISLVGGGLRLLNSDRQYASFLPASGVIILYVTVFAAGRYYAVLPFEMAIGATAVISAFCIWLYLRIQHDAYPLIASVGAYAAPIILGLNPEAIFPLYYFIVCSLAFAAIAVWMQSRTLILVSAYLAIVVTSWVGWELRHDMLVASILAIHFVIFSLDTYFYTRHHSAPLRQDEAWFFLPVLLIFYTLEYHFIGQVRPGLAPWISLEFAGVLIGLYLSAKIYFPTGLTRLCTQ